MCGGELLAPLVGARNLVVVCVIEGEFHHITGEALVADQGGKGASRTRVSRFFSPSG